MKRRDVMEILAGLRTDQPMLTGPGASAGLLWELADQPATIYNMDMAYCVPIALGIAMAAPTERVVAIEGDGSMIAALGVLTTIGHYQPPNLVVVVMDNGVYASSGDGTFRTASGHGLDLADVARSCGLPADRVQTVDEPGAARDTLTRAMTEPGPWLVVARIGMTDGESGWRPKRVKPQRDIVDCAGAFKAEMLRRGHGVNWINNV